jgi:protoporphyrinogen oxidase
MRVVVLGAGPAGLAAAWRATQDGHQVTVLEQEPRVGGQSATIEVDGFRFDYGPHAYHVRHSAVDALYHRMLGDEEPRIIQQQVWLKGKRFHYPFRFYELLTGINPFLAARMIADYLWSTVASRVMRTPDDSFENWVKKRFGRSLYQLCFGQYTERVWGMSPRQISARLASSKLSNLSLRDIVRKLFGGRGQEQATFWVEFLYPERGIGALYEALAAGIEEAGGTVHLSAPVRQIEMATGRAAAVHADGVSVEADRVISTIPLRSVVEAAGLLPVVEAARSLRQRALMLVNVALDRPQAMAQHWIYLLDPQFRFNRFAEQKNLGAACAPADRTALSLEVCCDVGDELWHASDESLYDAARADLQKTGLFADQRFEGLTVLRCAEAYPIYDLGFEKDVAAALDALAAIPNLLSVGRQGLFLNCDMHNAMAMGMAAAEFLAEPDPSPAAWYARPEHSTGHPAM